ncbi:unnamed protein product [Darwinula stevensoni]|uniref:NECAP PHear domain-containing protein n=1 Tax=Darwinula stevensoni TaxID=69355 RepID=A0A7R9A0Q8_9CRUS|nr:unnamed protein product [Darwinula stevensoni]CAG0885067.1 unnamed protein product [Darwinula stevensoni]
MEAAGDYESVLLVKNEVFVYKIPPRTTSRGYRAADWNLGAPDWTGRLRLVVKGKKCFLKLEDKISGQLYGQCPIDQYPGLSVESVLDSSRYFVIRIQDDSGQVDFNDLFNMCFKDEVFVWSTLFCMKLVKLVLFILCIKASRTAFVGVGFADRSDSFDLNVALQDHFKWVKKSEELEQEEKGEKPVPSLDLQFKEGQTININVKIAQKEGNELEKGKPKQHGANTGILPPPPGGVKLPPPPGLSPSHRPQLASVPKNPFEDMVSSSGTSDWGDFTSASA